MSPITAPTGESIIPIDLKIRQLTRLPLHLAVLACLALFGLLFHFRSPLQASVYGSRKVLNSKATYIPIIPNDSAMQSVKIVEAVTKQTGTVIFLHVSAVVLLIRRKADIRPFLAGSRRCRNFVRAVRQSLATATPTPAVRFPYRSDPADHLELWLPYACVSVVRSLPNLG
jgi:hypothetical protein